MKRKFDLITDSGCDMPEEYLKEKDVVCIKLGFTMDNINYGGEDGERIDERTFYEKLRGGAMPTTYQITAETAKEYMEKSLEKGRDVLVIAFSGALSGTAGGFAVAGRELAKKYPEREICVVDSLCASMGEGLLLDYVVKYAESGASAKETAKYAEELKLCICHHFTVDNLFHLKRGGRVSGATAVVGTILKIKQIMHVDDEGRLTAVGKAIGRKKSLNALIENMFTLQNMDENDPVFISHGDCMEDVEYVKDLILQRLPNVQIKVHYVGAVIGAHSGAGTLAIFHKGKHR